MLAVAEYVRVTAFHLVGDAVEDVVEREMAGFLGHSAVEHHLELKIAELVGKRVHVGACDCVRDFVGFLDRVGRDRFKRLHRVPFASGLRIAEAAHDLDEALKRHEGPRYSRNLKV